MDDEAHAVADALGVLLQRRFREGLHGEVVAGVHPAVDAQTYPVLSGLARTGPRSAAALGAEVGLDRSVVSRRCKELVRAGLLQAAVDERDARASLLSLTPSGEQVVAALRQRLVASVHDRLRSWPLAERQRFAAALTRFVDDL